MQPMLLGPECNIVCQACEQSADEHTTNAAVERTISRTPRSGDDETRMNSLDLDIVKIGPSSLGSGSPASLAELSSTDPLRDGITNPLETRATTAEISTLKFDEHGPKLLENATLSRIARSVSRCLEGGNGNCSQASFTMAWNPFEFMRTQYNDSRVQLGQVLTISGTGLCAQAATCKEYMRYVWGSSGLDLLKLLQDAFSRTDHKSKGMA